MVKFHPQKYHFSSKHGFFRCFKHLEFLNKWFLYDFWRILNWKQTVDSWSFEAMDIGIWHKEWWFEPPILFRAHKTSERTNDEDTSSVTMVIIRLQLCRTRTLDDHQLLQIGWCLESRSSMGLRRTADRWAAMYPQGALGCRGEWIPPCNISSLNFRVKPKSLPCSAEPKSNAPVLSCLWKSFIFRCFFYWTKYRFRNNAVSHCHVFFFVRWATYHGNKSHL